MNIHQTTALTLALLGERIAEHIESGRAAEATSDAVMLEFGAELLVAALAKEHDISPDKIAAMRALLQRKISELPDDQPLPDSANVVANFLRQRNKADLN